MPADVGITGAQVVLVTQMPAVTQDGMRMPERNELTEETQQLLERLEKPNSRP